MQGDRTLLQVDALTVAYGGIEAVKGVSFTICEGDRHCLIGANGAGKSSTLAAIAGATPLAAGRLRFAGEDIDKLEAHARVRRGIALVPEGRGLFARLTVAENLRLGAYARNDRHGIEADLDKVFTMLPRIHERLHQTAGTLSGGEQQMLAIARALMSRPRLLLLDEPSMGLAPRIVDTVFEVLDSVSTAGLGILLVEQNARLALEFAAQGHVMENGRIVLSGRSPSLLEDTRVRRAYLGGD
ncbi:MULTISPECIES: ABC transporter ATP-binding protein [unclassified Thauera]|uniref:ABC transporter ATP-binding protein n=1 Tax=unclassified Thauera TaxID=2609274 RepID=UPI0002CF75F5|nr:MULTISPECIES: ABC transporter ATP-binding protein [unclassified Thauera]ENO92646.1 ABC transporter ATP-binding protein [Thauera sp. 28]WBL63954.1 ABC transporter ATP-binding protein [Thauera sp. WB-2]HNR60691.1 ABC transporter ATP-binding protein [Thauera sp.]HNS92602.1 ABC transporter ATP-binding protein [Thauera sp.]HRJ24588.1 ABC transporter ATP-binding protein [Thauera sp.]